MGKTDKALQATAKIAELANDVFGSAAKEGMGILKDHLELVRWQRRNRLADRYFEIKKERQHLGKPCEIPPNFALRVIEEASIEEDDELQDIWIRLLDSAGKEETSKTLRRAFVDIVKQLEPFDAKVLEIVYNLCITRWDARSSSLKLIDESLNSSNAGFNPLIISITQTEVKKIMKCSGDEITSCLDNLFRLRLLTPYIEEIEFDAVDEDNNADWHTVSLDHQHDRFRITTFGLQFIESCITK